MLVSINPALLIVKTVLVLLIITTPKLAIAQCDEQLYASDAAEHDNFGSAMAIDGEWIVVGAFADDDDGSLSGSAYIYRFDVDTSQWIEYDKIKATDAGPSDKFGSAVAIDGEVIVVGAPGDNANKGSAYVFRLIGETWTQQDKLTGIIDLEPTDRFGETVDVSGDAVIIGAFWDNDACPDEPQGCDSGSASIFRYDPDSMQWPLEQKLLASDQFFFDMFGVAVAIDGDVAVIGAHGEDDCSFCNNGSAYIFRFDGFEWIEEAKLRASDSEIADYFGRAVAIDANRVVIGVQADDSETGSAWLFEYNGETWDEGKKLTASDREEGDLFGLKVAISDDTIIMGAPGDNAVGINSGSVYVYKYDGVDWIESRMNASDGQEDQLFALSVAIDVDTVLAGMVHDDHAGTASGSVYLYQGLDDCNNNGIRDQCELNPEINLPSPVLSPIGVGSSQLFTIKNAPLAAEDLLFTFTAQADLSAPVEFIDVTINGVFVGTVFETGAADCSSPPDEAELIVFAALFNDAMRGSNDAVIVLTASDDVDPTRCNGTSFITMLIRYTGLGTGDEDNNGILDICESTCPGDTDGSGEVGTSDLLGLLAAWGSSDPIYDIAPDGGDGIVNTQDLLVLLSMWGPCP